MSTPDVLREIRRATRPYGVAAAHRLALTDRQRRYALQTGVLAQPYPGVCIDPAAPATPHRDLQAAVAAARTMSGAWGLSAAWLWSLIDEPPCGPRIVVPIDRYVRLHGVFVRRATDLCPAHLMNWKHIPVTKPLITAIDLGAELSAMDLAEVYVRARQLKLFEPAAVEATLARIARRGRDGVSTSRDALALVMIGDRPADSVLELRFHHGPGQLLPPYEYQHTVVVDGKRYRIDFAYPDVKVGIEVDGYDKRTSPESLRHDARKTTALVKAGWTVPHFTWPDVKFEPSTVAADVLFVLRALGYNFCR